MSYAVRKDGKGWRAVNSLDDCTKDEIYSEIQPEIKMVDPRIGEIKMRLNQIDSETLRPLRAVYAGTDTPEDHAKLEALENEANQLREELKNAN